MSEITEKKDFLKRINNIIDYAKNQLKKYKEDGTEIVVWSTICLEEESVNLYIRTEGVIYPLWYDAIVVDIYSNNPFDVIDNYLKSKKKNE